MNFKSMIALVVALVGLDQGVKYLVETNLAFQTLVDVLPFLGAYRTWNEGVAFSLLWGLDDRALIIGAVCRLAGLPHQPFKLARTIRFHADYRRSDWQFD
jgi:lipoprotein signal peptidase